jgi:hypothetical protein
VDVRAWRSAAAAVWFLGIVATWFVARLDPDLHLCRTSTAIDAPTSAVETERTGSGKIRSTITTTTPAATQSTTSCEPVGAVELAILLVPCLILVVPELKSMSVPGLFGVEFRTLRQEGGKTGASLSDSETRNAEELPPA